MTLGHGGEVVPTSSTEVGTPGHCHRGGGCCNYQLHSFCWTMGFNYTWARNTRLQCQLSVLGVLQTRTDAEAAWDENPGHY